MEIPLPDYRTDPEAYELEERARPDEMAMITCAGFLASQWLDTTQSARCLDLCCGTGLSMEWLINHRNVSQVVGVDSCKEYLTFARRAYSAARLQPQLVLADAVDNALRDEPFDIIMLASAYHHIQDERKVEFLRQVRRMLGSDGRAIVAENILPLYSGLSNSSAYLMAVRLFYDAVLRTARMANPDLPARIAGLIERAAKYGIDGEYEYKVCRPILADHIAAAGLAVHYERRVWPLADGELPGDGGNYVLVLRPNT